MSTTPQQPPVDDNEPLIPPQYLLLMAAAGLVTVVLVFLTQSEINVIGWIAMAFSVLALAFMVLTAPQYVVQLVTGRAVRFGGTSIAISLLFVAMLVVVYNTVRQSSITHDFTVNNTFTLTEETRERLNVIGSDPSVPAIRIYALYGINEASLRDQNQTLFETFKQASSGKVDYVVVDPLRQPDIVQQLPTYNPQQGPIVFVAALDADGVPQFENSTPISSFSGTVMENEIANAVLRAAARGDFRAYFLDANDTLLSSTDFSELRDTLVQNFNWRISDLPLIELTSQTPDVTLNDPTASAELLVVAGGTTPLNEAQLTRLREFVQNGGDLIVMASEDFDEDSAPLALDPAFADFLYTTYGARFTDSIVTDPRMSYNRTNPATIQSSDLNRESALGLFLDPRGVAIFDFPHAIEIAPNLPADIVAEAVLFSSERSFLLRPEQLTSQELYEAADQTPNGPHTLAATSINSTFNSRLVLLSAANNDINGLFGQTEPVLFYSMVWATNYEEFFSNIEQIDPRDGAQTAQLTVLPQQAQNLSTFAVFILPFGILGLGVVVWYLNRERARA
jgi:hypothetical protein